MEGIPGRWGGDEFVVLAQNTDLQGLEAVAQRLRILLEATSVPDLEITCSVGATVATDTDTVDSIIARADSLMYRSKAEGGNRVSAG
jgi:diguanylate cyclase (GGDEF)-like protein